MRAIKPHIGIYGRCNAGKSTLLNFIIGEELAIVSEERGTTTDPVRRSFEILDFAPIIAIDTAGYDDTSSLGLERISKTVDTLHHIDLAIILYRGEWNDNDAQFLQRVKGEGVNYIIVNNCIDGCSDDNNHKTTMTTVEERNAILNIIRESLPEHSYTQPSMMGKYISSGDVVVMVCPIDSEAPTGRLILPQVQAIRDALDNMAISVVVQLEQLDVALKHNLSPKLIVTDSQVIEEVMKITPKELHSSVTTFSILLAELKGDVGLYREGLKAVMTLKAGDKILIMESCVHQTSCDDIGRVKIPKWLNEKVGAELEYDFLVGLSALPDDLEKYSLIIQCGGCMITARQLKSRIYRVSNRNVPITNYGMLIKELRG